MWYHMCVRGQVELLLALVDFESFKENMLLTRAELSADLGAECDPDLALGRTTSDADAVAGSS